MLLTVKELFSEKNHFFDFFDVGLETFAKEPVVPDIKKRKRANSFSGERSKIPSGSKQTFGVIFPTSPTRRLPSSKKRQRMMILCSI